MFLEKKGIAFQLKERERERNHMSQKLFGFMSCDIFKVDELNVEKEIRIKFILGRRELKKKKLQHDSQLEQIIAVILLLLLLLFVK